MILFIKYLLLFYIADFLCIFCLSVFHLHYFFVWVLVVSYYFVSLFVKCFAPMESLSLSECDSATLHWCVGCPNEHSLFFLSKVEPTTTDPSEGEEESRSSKKKKKRKQKDRKLKSESIFNFQKKSPEYRYLRVTNDLIASENLYMETFMKLTNCRYVQCTYMHCIHTNQQKALSWNYFFDYG